MQEDRSQIYLHASIQYMPNIFISTTLCEDYVIDLFVCLSV